MTNNAFIVSPDLPLSEALAVMLGRLAYRRDLTLHADRPTSADAAPLALLDWSRAVEAAPIPADAGDLDLLLESARTERLIVLLTAYRDDLLEILVDPQQSGRRRELTERRYGRDLVRDLRSGQLPHEVQAQLAVEGV